MKLPRAQMFGFLFGTLFLLRGSVADSALREEPSKLDEPIKVTACQLKDDPATYNHKLVQVIGFVSHGFEDFTLYDPNCTSWPAVWLEYGGASASGTMYCCGVTAARTRPKQLVIEKIPIPLIDDDRFRAFDKLIQRRPDSIVHATVVGRFFSGEQTKYENRDSWGGYGHMGCCSLLAIQQVISVDPQDHNNLDYRASADQPDIDKSGCTGYRQLLPNQRRNLLIEAQQAADIGQREWSFSDPRRVATDGLAKLLSIDQETITELKETRRAQGRIVYEWSPKTKRLRYMVVVSRPYSLSFYAKDPKKVAWVVIAAYESSCG